MADLLHSVPVDASPKKVYDAVATQEGMRSWWTRDTQMETRVGGKAEFGFDRRGMVFRMVVDALEPGKRIRLSCSGDHPEWAGTTLEWKIEPSSNGAVLNFIHRGWREITPFAASCNSTWGELMYRFKNYVEGRKPGPHWTE